MGVEMPAGALIADGVVRVADSIISAPIMASDPMVLFHL